MSTASIARHVRGSARRHWRSSIILLAVLPTLLAACSSSSNHPSPSKLQGATTTISWGIYADPSRLALAQAQVAAFERLNPTIHVNVEQVPFATYYQKLGSQVASGTAYDVMMMSGSYFSKIVSSGALENLTPLLKSSGIDLADYTTEPLNSEYKGQTYTLPYEIDIQALAYNKADFAAMHVPLPTANWTWSDLLAAAKRLTGTINGKQVYGFYSDDLYPSWVSFIGEAGGTILNSNNTKATLTTPAVTKAITFMYDLMYKYHVSPTPGQVSANTDPFETGQVAMALEGSYSVPPLLKDASFPWGLAPVPGDVSHAAAYWTQGIAVYAHSSHLAAANKFAVFLASKTAEQIMAEQKFAMPSLKAEDSSSAYTSAPPSGMSSFAEEVPSEVAVPFVPQWFALMDGPTSAIGAPFSALWLNHISVGEALSEAQAKVNAVLSGSA